MLQLYDLMVSRFGYAYRMYWNAHHRPGKLVPSHGARQHTPSGYLFVPTLDSAEIPGELGLQSQGRRKRDE